MQIILYTYLQKNEINILTTIYNKNRFINMCDFQKNQTNTQKIYSDGQPVTTVTANIEGKK